MQMGTHTTYCILYIHSICQKEQAALAQLTEYDRADHFMGESVPLPCVHVRK